MDKNNVDVVLLIVDRVFFKLVYSFDFMLVFVEVG